MFRRKGVRRLFAAWLVFAVAFPGFAADPPAAKPRPDARQETTVDVVRDGKTITVTQTVDGEFAGEIVTKSPGKPDESESIRARSLAELAEKFPAAHAAFTAEPAPAVKPDQQGISVKESQVNGQRKVEAEEPGRKIVIQDQARKKIVVTLRQTLEHGARTDRFEAPDFDALRKKFPEAARLYLRYGGKEGLQAVLRAKSPRGPGPRKIVADYKDRRLTIRDQNREQIKITVQPLAGDDEPQEYEADTLADLQRDHPEIARLYEQFAGAGPANPINRQSASPPVPFPAAPEPEPREEKVKR